MTPAVVPDKPSETGESVKNNTPNKNIKTGDETPIVPYLVLFIIAGIIVFISLYEKILYREK